jgi:NAD(P)H dehydrogenase (quinone)
MPDPILAPPRAPLRHVVVLAHPDPNGFNATIAKTYCETVRACGQEAIVRDLYALGFDPVLQDSERPRQQGIALSRAVRDEIETIGKADIYTLVYPVWFGMPPAMMKGYIDRVLGAGVTASALCDRSGQSVLTGRHLLTITTSGAQEGWLKKQGQVEALNTLATTYLGRAFGMTSAHGLHVDGIVEGLSKTLVEQKLMRVERRISEMCEELAMGAQDLSPAFATAKGS